MAGISWPAHLRPGALRWSRASGRYQETIAFYRDLVALPVVGDFTGRFGEDGTIFGLPDTSVQMEIVRADFDSGSGAGAFDQLVLYLNDADDVAAATAALRARGLRPDPAPHAYWAANGADVYRDPDGRDVVFAPWVYGRDAEPADRATAPGGPPPPGGAGVRIEWFEGDRSALRVHFEQAEDSSSQLDAYLDAGRLLVASGGPDIVGHLQLVSTARSDEVELKNMAVVPQLRGTGIGSALVDTALHRMASEHATRVLVATATADVGNLRFYQRRGFRFLSVERDAFTPATGYARSGIVDGIPLLDRVWLSCELQRREPA
jgi:GNAT superfamily N-acetyltransferase